MKEVEQQYILNDEKFIQETDSPNISSSFAYTFYYGKSGVKFIKECECPHVLAIVIYMSTFRLGEPLNKDELFKHFYSDNQGNLMFLEYALDRMVKNGILFTNK